MKILITDAVEKSCRDIFQNEGFEVHYKAGMPPAEVEKVISDYDALIVRSSTQVTEAIIHAGRNLKVIGRAGAGVDNIDVRTATRHGIIVMNTPGGNTISTAEHTMSMILALSRNIPQANASLREGRWERKQYIGTELHGKTIGIVGLGRVGREVAKRCQAFEMIVIGFDPVLTAEAAIKMGVEFVDFEEVLRRSDFITIHTPLNENTRHLLNEQTIRRCKPGIRIVNCARGGIVDEVALLRELESGKVAGAAFDVFEKEPPGIDPLLKHPRVIATPHLGASTEEAQEKVALQIARQVSDALLGRGVSGSVNADALQAQMNVEARPYVDLAEKMGSLVAQLRNGTLRKIVVGTYGGSLRESRSVLMAAVLKGIFKVLLSEPVNILNAPLIAQERGIAFGENEVAADDVYSHLVRVSYETERETRVLHGSVFGHSKLRIVGVDEMRFEIAPEGTLLFYRNVDRPGMLAAVGAILAEAGINISGVALGRYGVGSQALTVMSLDSQISQKTMTKISSLGGVSDASQVRL